MRLKLGSHETHELKKFLIFSCFPGFLIQISENLR